jgi:hypothetical protein
VSEAPDGLVDPGLGGQSVERINRHVRRVVVLRLRVTRLDHEGNRADFRRVRFWC